jgi:hypothetical protein
MSVSADITPLSAAPPSKAGIATGFCGTCHLLTPLVQDANDGLEIAVSVGAGPEDGLEQLVAAIKVTSIANNPLKRRNPRRSVNAFRSFRKEPMTATIRTADEHILAEPAIAVTSEWATGTKTSAPRVARVSTRGAPDEEREARADKMRNHAWKLVTTRA